MSKDLNRVMLIWRLTQDVELKKSLENWTSVATFTVATNRKYKNSEWNVVEESEFHRCIAFWRLAESLEEFVWKGKRVYIEWRLRTRKWEDNQWQIKYFTDIIVEDFIALEPKDELPF